MFLLNNSHILPTFFRFKSFKKKKEKKNKKHDWFDGNCFSFMKRELRNLAKKMHKFPNDVNIRVSFHRLREEFKKNIKRN